MGAGEETGEPDDSTSNLMFDSPEAKILASIRTKKFFNYSRMLAEYVQDEFSKQGRVDRGAKQRDNEGIWVLQATAMPSILVETGFVNNREEEDYLDSEKGKMKCAYAIMRAVLRYKTSLETALAAIDSTSRQMRTVTKQILTTKQVHKVFFVQCKGLCCQSKSILLPHVFKHAIKVYS